MLRRVCAMAITTLVVAGCGSTDRQVIEVSDHPVPIETLAPSINDVWQIAIRGATTQPAEECLNDRAVGAALASADMPSSHITIVLVPGATELDATRISECVQRGLADGSIEVLPPSRG